MKSYEIISGAKVEQEWSGIDSSRIFQKILEVSRSY